MTTIKNFTDVEQSKKLAEVLPRESADMYYPYNFVLRMNKSTPEVVNGTLHDTSLRNIPCWSLAALLEILAKIASKVDDDGSASLSSFMGKWSVNMFECPVEATDNYDNPVDSCYEMILKLNKLKML
jgi:hypothetical protein